MTVRSFGRSYDEVDDELDDELELDVDDERPAPTRGRRRGVLHWAHGVWAGVPEIPTLASLGVIVAILAVTTCTILLATREKPQPTPVG